MVKTYADLYTLKAEDVAALESESTASGKTIKRTVGEKTAKKVVDNVAGSRERPLERLLAGLGIHHIGQGGSRALANAFGSIDAITAANVEQLAAVEDIGEITAQSVHDFFHSPAGTAVVATLKAVNVDPEAGAVGGRRPVDAAAGRADGPRDRHAADAGPGRHRGDDRRARRQGER